MRINGFSSFNFWLNFLEMSEGLAYRLFHKHFESKKSLAEKEKLKREEQHATLCNNLVSISYSELISAFKQGETERSFVISDTYRSVFECAKSFLEKDHVEFSAREPAYAGRVNVNVKFNF
jgi:hypothetical protein